MNHEENELLCRIGPGTAMGTVVRNYWVPAFPSTQLPMQNSDPIRVRLFGENYVAFRGDDGTIGFLDESCPHRGAPLVFGHQEGCAIRCLYHGWKIGTDGTILETPNAEASAIRKGLKANAYPVEESHGLVWVYLGPQDTVPPRPKYVWEQEKPEHTLVVDVDWDCNWVQALEGLLDSSHAGILHADILKKFPPKMQADGDAMKRGLLPRFELERTDFGLHYAAVRSGAGSTADADQVRITAYAAPFVTFVPTGGMAFIPVPVDDTHTKFYNVWWDPDERLDSGPGYEHRLDMWGVTEEILRITGMTPTMPPVGEIPPRNVWPQDRVAMRAGESFTGFDGITAEDAALAVGMGPIVDRSKEHLVASDIVISRTRRILLKEARTVGAGGEHSKWQTGKTPPEKITAASGDLLANKNWRDMVPDHVAI
ncbi:Rieske 2Fe-2S domain-containing protein [Rhodococcus sp. NPDC057529]|uniref:Rieske 2Fe-2S domain-containing protein n=1 Tax=Rhodococcus sp. NPDC057529 TaxID=3346158 RepID=UPI00366AAA2D